MNDGEGGQVKLAEMLRHPDDLDKIAALRSEFARKKAGIDAQLKHGLKEQLEVTQSGMSSITDGQRTVNQIKDEMMKIDKLCAEAQNMIRDFPNINLVSQTHRNFSQVERMRTNLETFNDRLSHVESLLRQDDDQMEEMPNLLPVHYELSQLRSIRDDAIDQITKAADTSLQGTLEDYFTRLDDTINWFDEHVGMVCLNMINVVQNGSNGLIVRLAVIIEEEEKNDQKVKALQEAQRDYKDLAARFKSINTGPKELRGYKEKFLEAIRMHAQEQFDTTMQQFLDEPDKLEKGFRWFFNDLNTVKLGMTNLMPKKWMIFKTYASIYHTLMHDNLVKLINDPELPPTNLLTIIHWTEKYYKKLAKLGLNDQFAPELQPHVIDNREADLVREWRQLIIKFLEEWMARIAQSDKKAFLERAPDALDRDENGYFRTRNLVDMWRMLKEQIMAAATAERTDVAEGVIDSMLRVLKSRQTQWQRMVDDESARYRQPASATFDPQEGYQSLQDWLAAVANDQIACIDDGTEEDESQQQLGYLTRFRRDFEPLVSAGYLVQVTDELDRLRDGYVDLSTHCVTTFADLIFTVDFRPVTADFFTSRWYSEAGMKRLITTFEDYLSDYSEVLHPSLMDIFVEELSDVLLIRYLGAIRNKGVKFRRSDPFEPKLRDDILTAFGFFERFPDFNNIKQKWRVVDWFGRLLAAEKLAVADVYASFKAEYWDLQLSWVEAVLRSRDDYERSMLNAVKAKAASGQSAMRGSETIMSKIK